MTVTDRDGVCPEVAFGGLCASPMKRALITGITGQDGSYLAEFLLQKGYEVHGIIRRSSSFNTGRIDHLYRDPHEPDAHIHLYYGDLGDSSSLRRILTEVETDEVYNLGAQSHVRLSFDQPEYTADVVAMGCIRLLEAIRDAKRTVKFYQASSSEMYGRVAETPQTERTPFHPRSPYACAKAYAFYQTVNYREAYDRFACNGILFNHESPLRGAEFVTRKITRALAEILAGKQQRLYLGNLKARRDWGYAPEYVQAMWKIMQQDKPSDYVIGTGETHSVEEFLQEAFRYAGRDWKEHVSIDQRYFRPTEVEVLVADSTKARKELG